MIGRACNVQHGGDFVHCGALGLGHPGEQKDTLTLVVTLVRDITVDLYSQDPFCTFDYIF